MLYSDLNTYTPTDKPLVEDLEAIHQSINTIISTRKGERMFLPEFGLDIDEYLFDLMDELTLVKLMDSVVFAIETYEPRVSIDMGKTTIKTYPDEHKIDIHLVYNINGLGDQLFSSESTIG
jgi:phage baseplate assembly protein W